MKKILALITALIMIFSIVPLNSQTNNIAAINAYAALSLDNATLNTVVEYQNRIIDLIEDHVDYSQKALDAYKIGSDYLWYSRQVIATFGEIKNTLNNEYSVCKNYSELSEVKTCVEGAIRILNAVSLPSELTRINWLDIISDINNALINANGYFVSANTAIAALIGQGSVTKYTVYFNANGGSVSPSSISVTAGCYVTLPTPTRNGYTCLGWADSSTASKAEYNCGVSYKLNSNTTIYAVWKSNSDTNPGDKPAPSSGTETDIRTLIINIWNRIDNFITSSISSVVESFGAGNNQSFINLWNNIDSLFRILINYGIEFINTILN